jgi:MoaA/NifB/PqqE/SkfB family radical SAM enzyme
MQEKKIHFAWDIHYRCNYRCPFCWFNENWEELDKSNRNVPVDEMLNTWKRIHDIYGECHILIIGGEPTLYPNFIDLIEQIQDLHTIKVSTQLSGDMYTFAQKINPGRVSLEMNYHPMETKLEPFIRKVITLKKAGFSTEVCFLAYPAQIDRIPFYQKRFEERGIDFSLKAFWGEYGGQKYPESYTEEEKEMIAPSLKDADRIKSYLSERKTKDKLCRAGHSYASIKADGTVVRCGALSSKPLGNIFDLDFKLYEFPKSCEADACLYDEYVWLADNEEHLNLNL